MEEANFETPVNRKYPLRKRTKVNYDDYESPSDIKQQRLAKKLSKTKEHEPESEVETDDEKENETESEDEDENVEEISEYEKLRLKNIEENRRVLISLGLIDPTKEQEKKAKVKIISKPKRKREKKPKILEPTKRSMRLLGMTPEKKEKMFLFQETPIDSPVVEEKTRIEEEVLPMGDDGETVDFLDSLKSSLSQDSAISSADSMDSIISDMRNLKFANDKKVTKNRAQSLCVHPMENQLLMITGGTNGQLGLWNASDSAVVTFSPHLRPLNCISVSADDTSKVFTTSHDGTVRCADLNKSAFNLVYASDEKRDMCHLTWHAHLDANTLLVAHGTGETGVVDVRSKGSQRWFHCHPRSVRTLQIHPSQPHYFMSASGTGECKIWDLRGSKKHVDEHIADLSMQNSTKGLTSSFFSPDGNRVVQTCNDDCLRIYDSSDIANPKLLNRVLHDNHTGRWLSVFKAVFHPSSSDLIFVGSMLRPRRIQMYNNCGVLVREVQDNDNLTTVVPVLALHPTLPVLAGANSSGRVHIFTTKQVKQSLVKEEDSDSE